MRIPTNEEYDRLIDTAGEDDSRTHWKDIYSIHVKYRAVRGYYSARYRLHHTATSQNVAVGFRPAFELCEVDTLAPEGKLSIVGTLYMDGEPVEVPMAPKDITGYIPGAKLEIRPPMLHPGYIVTGYRVGDVVVADRVLLNRISYEDIEKALQGG